MQYIYIYIPKYKCFWLDCYGMEATLFKNGNVSTILTGIDRSRNHYLVVDMKDIKKSELVGGVGEKDSNNNTQWKQQNRIYSSSSSISLSTGFMPYFDMELAIRKPTPLECFRLMNVKTEDYKLISEHLSDRELYHISGDSICSNVLMAIFGEMLDINWKEKFREIEKQFKEDI